MKNKIITFRKSIDTLIRKKMPERGSKQKIAKELGFSKQDVSAALHSNRFGKATLATCYMIHDFLESL